MSQLDSPDTASDEAIGTAFRRSLMAFVLIAAIAAVALWWKNREVEEPAPEDVDVEAPQILSNKLEAPALPFVDITSQAGLSFERNSGSDGQRFLPETMGSGCAFTDYDGDGDADLVLVDSCSWTDWRRVLEQDASSDTPVGEGSSLRLYANDGTGSFSEVTEQVGLAGRFYGMGVAVGDVDGDGDEDLVATAVGPNYLWLNEGQKFRRVVLPSSPDLRSSGELAAGQTATEDWSTSAGFFDADNDGDLDLFLCNYVRWSPEIDEELSYSLDGGKTKAYGPPTNYQGAYMQLLENTGNAEFRDVSDEAGLLISNSATGLPVGKGLALAFRDIDRDGLVDVFIANDTVQNFLFRNLGGLRFEDIASSSWVAFDREGRATGAMGIDAANYRNDDLLGFAVGNFANEMTSLYVLERELRFADDAIVEGLGAPSRSSLTFGLLFFDADLDGAPDLLQVNGHLEQEINTFQPSQHYRQPGQLFWNSSLVDASASRTFLECKQIGDLQNPLVGRGAAFADIDGDGDVDLCLTQAEGQAVLLRNDQASVNHWLRVKLEGSAALGSQVSVTSLNADGSEQVQRLVCTATRSYLSQSETTLTFGLGVAQQVEQLTVLWADGEQTLHQVSAVDVLVTLTKESE